MDKIKKVMSCEIKQVGEEADRVLRFIGSDETPDRDDDIIEASGWQVNEYLKNPVFLWAHNYDMPPLGKAIKIEKDMAKKCLVFDVRFPTVEELSSDVRNPSEHAKFIDTIYNLYRGGYLSATSVGFRGIKFKARDDDAMNDKPEWQRGRRYMEQSLLELSGVPVPSNPNALQQAKSAGVAGVERVEKALTEIKTVIPYKSYPTEPEATEWGGPTEIAAASVDDLKIISTWYDADNADTKQAYKLPHHRASDKHLIWRGVTAAMGALLGARGGANIPEADKRGTYDHLAKHYSDDFGKTAPEFKAYTHVELKSIFKMENCPHTCCVMCDNQPCEQRMDCCQGCMMCCKEMCEDCEKDCKMECCAMCQAQCQTICAACGKEECSMQPETRSIKNVNLKKADLDGNPSVFDILDALWKAVNPAGIYMVGGPYVEDLYPVNYPSGNVIIEKMDKYYLYRYEYKDGVATLTSDGVELDEIYVPKSYKRKAGATLSAKNRELLSSIHASMDGCTQKLKGFIDSAMPADPMMSASMTADMTASMTMMPPMDPMMMSAMRTSTFATVKVEMSDELKQALDEVKSQVLLLSQKMTNVPPITAPEDEINLDAIELPVVARNADDIELNIEPEALKNMIAETVRNLIRGGN